ncbi:MAG: hypothetical protein EOP00_15820, partial [Pedobacter sp.]
MAQIVAIGLENSKYATFKFIYIGLVSLISFHFWSYHGIPERIYQILEILVSTSLLFICLLNFEKLKNSFSQFKINVLLFISLPLLSMFAAMAFHGQSLFLSFFALKTIFFWLLYYVLHIFNIPVIKLVKLMTFIGVTWALITIIQNYTYPHFWFYNRNGEDDQEFIRAGKYRFMIDPLHFGLFIILYFYNQYLLTKRSILFTFVIIGLVGFYYYTTRQFIVGAVACMVIAYISQEGKNKIFSMLIIAITCGLLVYLKDLLFGEYIEITSDQLNSSDDIRLLSLNFWLFEYWPNWITVLIGNGFEHSSSNYGKEMLKVNLEYGYYRTDIGIFGTLSYFGIFYVINLLASLFKGLRNKYYTT